MFQKLQFYKHQNKNYKCLELGARQGGLSLWLALKGNSVVCSDISYSTQPHELQKAKDLHKKYNCEDRISCESIDALNKLISKKELQQKGLIQQLLFAKRHTTSFSKERKEYSFNNILKEVKRPVNWDDNELYKLISVRRRSGGLFHRESLYGHQIKTKNLRTALKGDLLISKMQILHGASGFVTDEFDSMKISGSYLALRSKDENILNIEYLDWYTKLPYFYHQCYICSYGVHIEKMTFNFKLFLKEKIKLPSIEEQVEIVKILNKSEQEIALLNQKLNKFKEQKKGLMQQLLTGKKRLKF